ncbi:hypothetical protein LEN26_019063 [Aphanomyces euteiches]|nr:hypothetical protein LEN26_019063 [Aphanomyces euteiches]
MAAGASTIFHSRELFLCISAFQRGVFHVALPLVRLKPEQSYLVNPTEIRVADRVLTKWYGTHGVASLPRVLECLPDMRLLLFLHAITYGRLDAVQTIHSHVQFIHLHDDVPVPTPTDRRWPAAYFNHLADAAAIHGHLDVLLFLVQQQYKPCTSNALTWAAANGHVHVVAYLHTNDIRGHTSIAVEQAAANGHLNVVRFLLDHRREECTVWAVNYAAKAGYLAIVQLLLDRFDTCPEEAMIWAAGEGHLNIVKYLHHRGAACTYEAMDLAARNGHLDLVKFLHSNRTEGCTVWAMNVAAEKGFLQIVEFLHEHRSEGCTTSAMDLAASNGRLEVVQFRMYAPRCPSSDSKWTHSCRGVFNHPPRGNQ